MAERIERLRILLTGGCGFIGSHTVREALRRANVERLVNLDALTYSGHPENLSDIADERYRFVHASINDAEAITAVLENERINVILNLAAESHVDRSIDSVAPFVETNIDGTRTLLECLVKYNNMGDGAVFVQISTDEVYGSLGPDDPPFTEDTPLDPRNPYAASKAAADMLVRAFVNTHGISACITRCSNNYGPNQFPEKLIPLMVLNSLEGRKLPVYGDGRQIRDWIHAIDHAEGILLTMDALISGRIQGGEVINFGADMEIANIDIINLIITLTESSQELIEYVRDRPGHDRRYAMGFAKAQRVLGWHPKVVWEEGLRETVEWYRSNPEWVDSVRSGDYLNWIRSHYS
jgi:dTDP-glucose 4,6-dehydratase